MQLKQIIHAIQLPFTSVEYYKNSIRSSFTVALARLLLCLLFLAFVSSLSFIQTQLPKIQNSFSQVLTDTKTQYPQDLVIEWRDAQLTANAEELTIPMPTEYTQQETGPSPEQFLLYVNSDQTPTELELSATKYFFFINKTSLYQGDFRNPQNWTQQSLDSFLPAQESFILDKASVTTIINDILEFTAQNKLAITIIFFVSNLLLFILAKLWFLFIETILVVLLFKLYRVTLKTKEVVILALHVMIPTSVLITLAELLYTDVQIPLQMITFWVLLIFLSFQFKTKKTN